MKGSSGVPLFLFPLAIRWEESRDAVAYLNHCQGSGLFTYTPLRIARGYSAGHGAVQNLLHGC